jgi:hypothetical protein
VLAAVMLAAQIQPVFHDSGNITSIAHWHFGPGEIFDFGVEVDNGSSQTVTLRSITLPNGIPAHVQLVHVVRLEGGGMISSMGWPLAMRTGPLDGARLPAHGTTFIVLALTADHPGAYLIAL